MTKTTKIILLLVIACLGILAAALTEPVAQDPAYHNFTDSRTLHGISNFWNVASNLPFLLFGLLGLYATSKSLPEESPGIFKLAYGLFFTGAILVSLGSSYYHLNPSIDTLVWDRLPMTIAFMALFSIIIAEFVSTNAGRFLLLPLLLAGAVSVIYWFQTEQLGTGDLRPYALVQFMPIVLIPLVLILFKSPGVYSKYIWALILVYVLSKVAEHFDAYIFDQLTGEMSGHSIKHFLASLGILFFYFHFKQRLKARHE